MFYIVWLVTAFAAVGVGCWVAGIVDKKNPNDEI
jgi:hypothetical protein